MLGSSPVWKHTTSRYPSPQLVTQHLPRDAGPDYLRSRHSHPILPAPFACFNFLLCISWSHRHTVCFTYIFPFCLSLPHESRGGESHALFSTVPPVPRADFPSTHMLNKSSTSCGERCHHLHCKDKGTEAGAAMSLTCPGLDNSQAMAEAGFDSRQVDFIMCQIPVLCTPYRLCHVNF